MLFRLTGIQEEVLDKLHGGEGGVKAKLAQAADGGVFGIHRIPMGSSVGVHSHDDASIVDYVSAGEGVAVCDGKVEKLVPGAFHYCPAGSKHSIANTGSKDLVLLTIQLPVNVTVAASAAPVDIPDVVEQEKGPVLEDRSAQTPSPAQAVETSEAEAESELAPWASQIHARLVCGIHDLAPDQTVEGYKRFIDIFSREPWMINIPTREARGFFAAAWKEYWAVVGAGDASVYSNWIQEMSGKAR